MLQRGPRLFPERFVKDEETEHGGADQTDEAHEKQPVTDFFFQSLLIGSWDCLLCFYTIKAGLPLSSIVKYTIIVNGLLMLFFYNWLSLYR